MKNHHKVLAALGCGLILSACQSTPTSAPTPMTTATVSDNASVIAYFSSMQAGGVLLPSAQHADIYRVLIKHDTQGYLVQDFYQSSKKPQSSPVLLTNPADLKSMTPTSIVGDLTLYYRTGQVYQRASYNKQHQPTGQAFTYNMQGKVVVEENNRSDGSYSGRFWYADNLHPALNLEMNTHNQIISAQGWNRHQQAIPNHQCFAEKTLNPQNTQDQCYQLLMQLYQTSSTLSD